ncbi:hypothetical protein LTR78_002654 [Recurvomyces mirabilis]|uniref:Lipocalin-like domain-containing protein n=1 Tax=Recurvomyces mirabilis TaxID=574656 RepID=A0AAE1C4R0_9PEZI|nr:hypothetical protein LTR78_002654 [Recurvomyces mirabilis]KAK5157583.1 hypothetical protein LTS14_004348 [Recurvomyces mirabilis]
MSNNIWPTYRDKIAGVWKLLSYEVFDGTGPDKKLVAKPHGDVPLGRVQISRNGYLSAHLTNPGRVKSLPSGKAWQEGGDAEVAYVARGHSMYCGYLKLFEDEKGLYWETRVDISTDPSQAGSLQVRRAELTEEGGKSFMVLQPERDMVMEDGSRTRGVLRWEKIE